MRVWAIPPEAGAASPSRAHTPVHRAVSFDLSGSPVHWLPDDVYSSHLINGIHLLLPAGELWFCRLYNRALPLITDERLKAEVEAFIRQEGTHARAHRRGEQWLRDNGYDVTDVRRRVDHLFEHYFGDRPLGSALLERLIPEEQWLIFRLGHVAAVEHFTGLLGDWALNSEGWDRGDPVVAELFRWHLAEEVEHRSVAFDLYEHLCRTRGGFQLGRAAIMTWVVPLMLYFIFDAGRALARQDPDPRAGKVARRALLRLILELEPRGRTTGHVPRLSFLARRTLRWFTPGFHPEGEGDTEQALAFLARSPVVREGR